MKNRKPSIPDGKYKQRASIIKNKLTASRSGLNNDAISTSSEFANHLDSTQGNRQMMKNCEYAAQQNSISFNPDPAKGIKASIGGEEFVMYRTNDIKNLHSQTNNHQREDDNDSVEIEMQEDDDFIHHTMKATKNVINKNKIFKKPLHQRKASGDIEYIELDMFEEYEEKIQMFL
jgi:hypothetical protein